MMPTKKEKNKASKKPLTSVMEDYLEAIVELDEDKKVVRVKDIAKRMDVKMPSVSSMLKTLNERGLVNYEKYEYVELTKSGADIGKEMQRRHEILNRFLADILKIEPAVADAEACKMEHALSSETLDRLTTFMEFIQECPRTEKSWLMYFEEYLQDGRKPDECCMRREDFIRDLKKQVEVQEDSNS